MTSYAFLLLISLASAANVPASSEIKIFGIKEAPTAHGFYESPFEVVRAVPLYEPSYVYSRVPNYPTVTRKVEVSDVPMIYDLYPIPLESTPAWEYDTEECRSASLNDLLELPVVMLIPGEDSTLQAHLCDNGLTCLSDIPSFGRSALFFHPDSVRESYLEELGVSDMAISNVAIPETATLSSLVRANYLLFTDTDVINTGEALLEDIGGVQVEGRNIRVFKNIPVQEGIEKKVIIETVI